MDTAIWRRSVVDHPRLNFNRRWRLEEFSWERPATRRPLAYWCYVLEEFVKALIGDIIHPAGNVLDEFLYGFEAEVASYYII
ncbi:hypothetical protein EVAR_94503_1 [Eumeta japonica]|uniref:Uncharacterized protein n=1 Tax=Eumeta variegata TaxID=151549 RepID=A0A4C1UUT5_EUMVA|nr:hypothetical protein EVAR_94503_1 [Eumeta japonica]